MQIIIPMAGIGQRFLSKGYNLPKPLLLIDRVPIIHHIIDLFPSEENFIFICNENHLIKSEFKMREIIKKKAPKSKIIGIKKHKLGPAYSISKIFDYINDSEEVIINYCDFSCYWDYLSFRQEVKKNDSIGAIPSFKNFHPHSLWLKNFAYIKNKDNLVLDIQEKKPFTDNQIKEFASTGTYYFNSGKILKQSINYCFKHKIKANDEYFISLAYKYLISKNKKITVHEVEHFMAWGTPEDYEEYISWFNVFKYFSKNNSNKIQLKEHALIIPMAGFGRRFTDEGYQTPKPLIKVKGEYMFLSAIDGMPKFGVYVFVLRKDTPNLKNIKKIISNRYPNSIIKTLSNATDGQATSCFKGVEALIKKRKNFTGSITFAACDNYNIYNEKKLSKWFTSKNSDVLVWGAQNHPTAIRSPELFGWIKLQNRQKIKRLIVKKMPENRNLESIFVGTVSFKSVRIFIESFLNLKDRDGRVNGELYLDSCINDAIRLGFNCQLFPMKNYISWGTPNDLKIFEYWENCFRKWNSHKFSGFKKNKN